MQGRQNQGENRKSWDRSSSQIFAKLDADAGTGKQRAIPQRPPGLRRLEEPPPSSKMRIVRPERKIVSSGERKKRLIILGSTILILGLLAFIVGYNFYTAANVTAGASATSTGFLSALETQSYDQAYGSLDTSLVLQKFPGAQNPADLFKKQAQADDHCFGTIKNYEEVAGSAQVQDNLQSYDYTITRSKLAKPYTLHLTLRQVTDYNTSTTSWKISDYGDDLGPQPPTCK